MQRWNLAAERKPCLIHGMTAFDGIASRDAHGVMVEGPGLRSTSLPVWPAVVAEVGMTSGTTGWDVFETAIGNCAIAWSGVLVRHFSLPDKSEEALAQRMSGLLAGERQKPPRQVASIIERIRRHLEGDVQFFGDVALRLDQATPFQQHVYAAAQKIMPGEVVTYGELAARLGKGGAARAVGHALGKNPIPLIVPCHRVVGVNRNLGGFSAYGGIATKRLLLEIEGIAFPQKRRG